MSEKPYREVDPTSVGVYEGYPVLVGPNDFECVLTEPEDRTWGRDLGFVVAELNRLHEENERLRAALGGMAVCSVCQKCPRCGDAMDLALGEEVVNE